MPTESTGSSLPSERVTKRPSRRLSVEERHERLARIIATLPPGVSSVLETLDPGIDWRGKARPCDFCKKFFVPKGEFTRFCTTSCGVRWNAQLPGWKDRYTPERTAKAIGKLTAWRHSPAGAKHLAWLRNGASKPSTRPEVVQKMQATMRARGHYQKILTGGNGGGLTEPQRQLLNILGATFQPEVVVPLGKRAPGYPTCYKIDVADQNAMIGIELNGWSHSTPAGVERDRKKLEKLTGLGWTMLTFSNQAILDWISLGTPTDHSISMTFKQHGITLSAWKTL